MANTKRIRVYYEGDDDKVVLQGLQQMNLVPAAWEIAQRDKQRSGKDGLVRELAALVRPVNGVGGSAIALVDLDDLPWQGLIAWFRAQIQENIEGTEPAMTVTEQAAPSRRACLFTITGGSNAGRVVLVPVGLADDPDLRTTHGIEKFAVDDHILRLVREERVYITVSELEAVPYELAMRKMAEVVDLLRRNGLPIRQTKRFLHVLRAVAEVRPSSAVFIERLMKKAREALTTAELRALFHPLVDDLDEAGRLLNE